jgi:hypothetical protein
MDVQVNFGGPIGAAMGIFLSVNWALVTDLIPVGTDGLPSAGKQVGLSNLATAGAGATSRLAGPLIGPTRSRSAVNALRPGTYLGYPTVFVLASVVTLGGTVLLAGGRKAAKASG